MSNITAAGNNSNGLFCNLNIRFVSKPHASIPLFNCERNRLLYRIFNVSKGKYALSLFKMPISLLETVYLITYLCVLSISYFHLN